MTGPGGDPKPLPPRQPEPEDCCRSGCTPCVFDLYESELQHYERELAAWEARRHEKENSARNSGRKMSRDRLS